MCGFLSFQSDTFAHHLSCTHVHSAFLHCWHKFCLFQLPTPRQAYFLKLNNAWQCIQANNYPHKFGASKCKTTATEGRKLGLIIKMCQVQVQQLFLFNKPCYFIVWLAFLGHGLSLTQALIKHTAFVTEWRTVSLSLTLPPALISSHRWGLNDPPFWDFTALQTQPTLCWGPNAVNKEILCLPKDSSNLVKEINFGPPTPEVVLYSVASDASAGTILTCPYCFTSSWPLQSAW